eukprot:183797_1
MSLLVSVIVSYHLIFTAISQSQCEDDPSRTTLPYDSTYYYNACVYPSIHSVSQSTVHITSSSVGSRWFQVTFSPLIHDCVGPKITFQYQETTYSYYNNYLRISDSNVNSIKQCGTLSNCGWTDCLSEYSLYDNLGVSEIKAGSNYTFHIYHEYNGQSHTCSGLGVNVNLTLSCLKAPPTPKDELVVNNPFRCSYLTETIAVFYDIDYTQCILWQCFAEFGSSCRMVNYFANTNPTRCYLFDKQCIMQSSEDSGDVVTFAIDTQTDFCIDYPYQWTDSWYDTCDIYQNLLNLCSNGQTTDAESVSYFQSRMHDGFIALDVCCACGGGQRIVQGVIITFDPLSKFHDGNVLCTTNYDTIRTMHVDKNWDNIMLYKLCTRLFDTVWWMLTYTLDCTMFLESSLDSSLTFDIFVCDFDGYVNPTDPYFLFAISMINSTSTSTFINNLWFDIIAYLLPSTPFNVSYAECSSMLSNINSSNSFLAVPCDEYIASPTSSPTLKPTAIPTLPTGNPAQQPTLRPTKMPTPPTLPTAPTLPTIKPTSHPTTSKPTNQSMDTTMVEADAMGEKSAVGLWKTTITVIFAGVLSTLILTFLFSYLWKHKIKGAQQENVEMAVQHQGVRDELVERFDIQEM